MEHSNCADFVDLGIIIAVDIAKIASGKGLQSVHLNELFHQNYIIDRLATNNIASINS